MTDTERCRATLAPDRALAQATEPPADQALPAVEEYPASGRFPVARDVVALIIERPAMRTVVGRVLAAAGIVTGGLDAIGCAVTIVVEVPVPTSDVGERLRQLRALARPDAAIIVLLNGARGEDVVAAHAAGAVAAVRIPFVEDELVAMVRRAVADHTLRDQVAGLSRQLDHQTHLASLGRISAGLSHELGNPLAVARLAFDEIREQLALHASARSIAAAVADVDASLRRMGELVQVMGELVGTPERRQLRMVALAPIVQRVRHWADLRDVDVDVVDEGDVVAFGDETLIEQVLINLTNNAVTAARKLVAPRIRYHSYCNGNGTTISVRDNGVGIPVDLHDRIFEPFYTTHRGEGGTGLGLALCREYARQMGGSLGVWSAPGRGACFRLHLRREGPTPA